MVARNVRTYLARHLLWLWDEIRGPIATIQDRDMEAAEQARRELCVIFEILSQEARKIQSESRAGMRTALYGPESSGRFLAVLGIPDGHRAWLRLDSVEARARERAGTHAEVRVVLGDLGDLGDLGEPGTEGNNG